MAFETQLYSFVWFHQLLTKLTLNNRIKSFLLMLVINWIKLPSFGKLSSNVSTKTKSFQTGCLPSTDAVALGFSPIRWVFKVYFDWLKNNLI